MIGPNIGDRIPQPQVCVAPKLQSNHNSSVFKILQIILFVFNILQMRHPVSDLFGILCKNRYPGGTPVPTPVPDLSRDQTAACPIVTRHSLPNDCSKGED